MNSCSILKLWPISDFVDVSHQLFLHSLPWTGEFQPIPQNGQDNNEINPLNAFPTHNINNSNSNHNNNSSSHCQKTNGYHEYVNSNTNRNTNNFNNERDEDHDEELEDLKRFERATKEENGESNHVFDPEQLAALHQHHHHHNNHSVPQHVVGASHNIHEAAFATHSKHLNGKGT